MYALLCLSACAGVHHVRACMRLFTRPCFLSLDGLTIRSTTTAVGDVTAPQVGPTFSSVIGEAYATVQYADRVDPLSRPGCWAYPDMSEIGNFEGAPHAWLFDLLVCLFARLACCLVG
jgi:hypothetical protein